MKFRTCALAGLLACGLSAVADTNLLTSGDWAVDGVLAPVTNGAVIQVAVGKAAPVSVSELKFFYDFGGSNFVQVWSVTGAGTFRPTLPPPGVVGGAFQMGSYRDCTHGLVGPLAVTELVLPSRVRKNGKLGMTGALANGDSLRGEKLVLKLSPPLTNSVRVDVECRLVATRDFCVDQTAVDEQDTFRVATMVANYVSPTEYENNLVRYSRLAEKICVGLYGCYTRSASVCANLTNATPGYLLRNPKTLDTHWLFFANTTPAPQFTPSLQVLFMSPSSGRLKPQGVLTATTDPAAGNVAVWGNWMGAKTSYKLNQTVTRLRGSLIATAPRVFGCDEVQPPATNSP